MGTKELYLEDSYLTTCESTVHKIDGDKVILDQTVFYPTGGEHDTGFLIQANEAFKGYEVKKEKGNIVHYVKNAHCLQLGKNNKRFEVTLS